VRVDHRGVQVFVAKQFLNGANILAFFEEVRGEAVPKSVAANSLGYAGSDNGFTDGPLNAAFVSVVATNLRWSRQIYPSTSCHWIDSNTLCRSGHH
jgi:hypothetical protein